MVNFKFVGASVLALGMSVSSGFAATLDVVGGELVGASDVNVGGSLFDVAFVDDNCVAAFGSCDPSSFTFTTEGDATLASEALLDQVLIDGPDGMFGSILTSISGIADDNNAQILTAFDINQFGTPLSIAAIRSTGPADGTTDLIETFAPLSDLSNSSAFVYAVWSEVVSGPVSPVPLPAGGLLLLSGLGVFAGARRRKKQTA